MPVDRDPDQFYPTFPMTCCPKCMDTCACRALCSLDSCTCAEKGVSIMDCENLTFTNCNQPECDNTDWHI